MTTPWQPGNGGAMIAPPGYVDPHDWSSVNSAFANTLPTELAGTLACTNTRMFSSNGAIATTSGLVQVHSIPLPAGLVVTSITVISGATAATGPTHFWMGLTDANLNVLAVTADQGAAAIAANTVFKLPLTVACAIPSTGLYYVVVSISTSTTQPTLTGGPGITAQVGGQLPVATGSAGNQATPPAAGTQLNAGTVNPNGNNVSFWLS